MTELSPEAFEEKAAQLGITIERFSDSDTIRLLPSKLSYLLCIPYGNEAPFSLKNLSCKIDIFYCVGREQVFALPDNQETKDSYSTKCRFVRNPISLSCEELCWIINETRPYRKDVTDDFYAIPDSGEFMIYVSHHNEILVYLG